VCINCSFFTFIIIITGLLEAVAFTEFFGCQI